MATATIQHFEGHAGFIPGSQLEAFSELGQPTLSALAKVSATSEFDEQEVIYSEGDPAVGMFVVLSGRVKLVVSSAEGKALILKILGPGEIFGLSSAFLGKPEETSAETLERTTVSVVKRAELVRLMERHGDLALKLARELSLEYAGLCEEMATLGLQRSAMSRLAKMIVGWTEGMKVERGSVHLDCSHTHEVMAQMIGTSRETVTRLLHQLRHQKIAVIKDEILTINNYEALSALAV